jgi:predicted SnoaL-like aldol condensation-catalyzing enzyme
MGGDSTSGVTATPGRGGNTARMSAEESGLLKAFREGYAATHGSFNEHDFDKAFSSLPQEVEWYPPEEIPGAPKVLRGRAEVIAFFTSVLDEWPDWRTEILDTTEPSAGLILVEYEANATGRASGVPARARMFQSWDFRSQPLRVIEGSSPESVLSAASA